MIEIHTYLVASMTSLRNLCIATLTGPTGICCLQLAALYLLKPRFVYMYVHVPCSIRILHAGIRDILPVWCVK